MSRIGKKIIAVPKGVTVTVHERELEVKGPKGMLKTPIPRASVLNSRARSCAPNVNRMSRLRCTDSHVRWQTMPSLA